MQVSRFLIAGAVAALLQTAAAVAQTPPPAQTPPTSATTPPEQGPPMKHPAVGGQAGVSFESLDKDGDGRISKPEAQADAKVSQQFTMYDKNGNGFIEKDEVSSSNNAPPETPKE
jgi:hypothetical protein